MYDDETMKMIESMRQEIDFLRGRLNSLESRQQTQPSQGLPNTWLLSPSLLKRAFGVYGHNLLAGFLISIPFLCLYFILMVVILGLGSGY